MRPVRGGPRRHRSRVRPQLLPLGLRGGPGFPWVDLVAQHGASETYTLPKLRAARSLWEQKRPCFTLGDDWIVAAFEAHRAFVASGGLPCAVRTCAVHYPAPARITAGPV